MKTRLNLAILDDENQKNLLRTTADAGQYIKFCSDNFV